MRNKIYEGIHNDPLGAMNPTGNVIRDAWVFGILPETQTCEGWPISRVEALYEQVSKAWEPYAHLPSKLPDDLREKHHRIYREAIERARELGWDPNEDTEIEA